MAADEPRRVPPRDQFLSEEDLDLKNLSWDELLAWWDVQLRTAQATNDLDRDEYSHGVFALPRREWPAGMRQRLDGERDGSSTG